MKEQEYFNVADIFGENVFNDSVMRERLPKKTYQKMKEVISQGRELDPETADGRSKREQPTIHIGSSRLPV